jgi:hypothetical protein
MPTRLSEVGAPSPSISAKCAIRDRRFHINWPPRAAPAPFHDTWQEQPCIESWMPEGVGRYLPTMRVTTVRSVWAAHGRANQMNVCRDEHRFIKSRMPRRCRETPPHSTTDDSSFYVGCPRTHKPDNCGPGRHTTTNSYERRNSPHLAQSAVCVCDDTSVLCH